MVRLSGREVEREFGNSDRSFFTIRTKRLRNISRTRSHT